jgi:DNA-binding transcriptional LysR family regulator
MDMELRHLRYFVAVAETLNFTTAARRLKIAQPPLSIQIRKLEEELGTSLFDRSNRKIQLTPAGRAFFREAQDILGRADQAVQELQDNVAGRAGKIVVRYTTAALTEKISKKIRKFIRKHRGVRIQVEPIYYEEIRVSDSWTGDLCLHEALPQESSSQSILEEATVFVAMSPKHRLAGNETITLSDLLGESLLLSKSGQRSAAECFLVKSITEPGIDLVQVSGSFLDRLWQASLGLGLAPCLSTEGVPFDMMRIPLEAGLDSRVFTTIRSHPHSHAAGADTFKSFLLE